MQFLRLSPISQKHSHARSQTAPLATPSLSSNTSWWHFPNQPQPLLFLPFGFEQVVRSPLEPGPAERGHRGAGTVSLAFANPWGVHGLPGATFRSLTPPPPRLPSLCHPCECQHHAFLSPPTSSAEPHAAAVRPTSLFPRQRCRQL